MKKNIFLTLTGILMLVMSSCKKDNTTAGTPPVITPPVDTTVSITAISPSSGGLNTTLTITGKNFKTTPGDNIVKIGGIAVPVTAATATTLTITVPQLLDNGGGAIEVSNTSGTKTGPAFTYTPDVYVAGFEENSTGQLFAKLWLNGTATTLANGTNNSYVSSLNVTATDVLVGGYSNNSVKNVPTVWKNGVVAGYSTTPEGANLTCTAIAGNNVYACGYENTATYTRAKYWLNGTGTNLTPGTSSHAGAYNMTVSGNNVYVCGYEVIGGIVRARLWTNGTGVTLNNGSNSSYAIAVAVSGSDVYVVGYEQTPSGESIRVWRNGSETAYTNASGYRDIPTNIFVKGSDVYVCGYERDNNVLKRPKYWKNGVATLLETNLTGEAAAIAVCGNDVYVAGHTNQSSSATVAKVYKNGVATAISNGSLYVYPAGIGLR